MFTVVETSFFRSSGPRTGQKRSAEEFASFLSAIHKTGDVIA